MKKLLKEKNISINKDHVVSFALVLIFSYILINNAVMSVGGSLSYILYYILMAFERGTILVSLYFIFRKDMKLVLLPYGIMAALYLLTFLCFPANTEVLAGTANTMFWYCLPALCFILGIEDVDYTFKIFIRMSFLLLFCAILFSLSVTDIDQGFGYAMLIPIMVLWFLVLNHKYTVFSFIGFLILFYFMVVHCDRGSLVVAVLYVPIALFTNTFEINARNRDFKRNRFVFKTRNHAYSILGILYFCIFVILLVLAAINIQNIARFIMENRTSDSYNKNLSLLASGTFISYTSGREPIYALAWKLIKNGPIFGYGLAGDTVQITKGFGYPMITGDSTYAHNLILGVLIHFGPVIGTVLMVFFFGGIILTLIMMKQHSLEQELFIMVMLYAVISTAVSGTYLQEPIVWITLGFIIRTLFVKNPVKFRFVKFQGDISNEA